MTIDITTIPGINTYQAPGHVDHPKASGYGVSINAKWYRLAAHPDHPVSIQTRDSLAERFDQRASAFENVLDVGYAFSRNNLTGGEGLDWYPRISQTGESIPLDTIRFWDSKNVIIENPESGQQYRMRLARDTRTFYTPATPPIDLATSKDFIWVLWGTQVDWFSNWSDVIPDGTFDFGTGVVKVVATPGNEVFVLTDDGHLWYKAFDTSTFDEVYDLTGAPPNDEPLTNIWVAKGRLIAERLDVVAISGTVELVLGTPVGTGDPQNPTWNLEFIVLDTARGRFREVLDCGVAVVSLVSDGSIRSYVPQSETSGQVPQLTIRGRTPTPTGEQPYGIGFLNGVIILLTIADEAGTATQSTRAYRAEVLDERSDFIVGNMQLLRRWLNTTEPPDITKELPVTRDRIYWTIEEEPGVSAVWLYDTVTTGVMRQNEFEIDLTALVIFDSIAGGIAGDSVIVSDASFVSSGYLISPNINFGLNTPINWMSVVIEGQEIQSAGDQIELWYSTIPEAIEDPDDASWVLVARISNPAQSGLEIPLVGVSSLSIALQVKIFPVKGGTVTPAVTRFAVRGFPAHRDWVVTLPINVSDSIEAPGRMPYTLLGYGNEVHDRLLAQSGESVEVIILDPPFWMKGVVDRVSEPSTFIGNRGSTQRYCNVQVRGTRVTGTGSSLGTNAGLGIGDLGIAVLGIAKVLEEV